METKVLILDIDGVLITNPSWRPDLIHMDGYSDFNKSCVKNLNRLFDICDFDIWLSSTRRKVKSINEFNEIFKNQGIMKEITGFLPQYSNCKNRKEEISNFINEFRLFDFLIVDDDKSLNGLDYKMKERLVLTNLTEGFNNDKLIEAIEIIN